MTCVADGFSPGGVAADRRRMNPTPVPRLLRAPARQLVQLLQDRLARLAEVLVVDRVRVERLPDEVDLARGFLRGLQRCLQVRVGLGHLLGHGFGLGLVGGCGRGRGRGLGLPGLGGALAFLFGFLVS